MRIHVDDIRPQLICEVQDEEFGRLGYLVIDRTLGDVAIGGIRQAPNVTIEEVAYLARAMTLKCSFLKLWMGGAKAGIAVPEPLITARRREILAAFGRSLGPLLRTNIYAAGQDLGISEEDVHIIRAGAGLPRATACTDSAHYTALTVVEAIRQTLSSQGRALTDSTVAIEGFGRVGSSVAELLAKQGASIVAVSTCEGAIYNPAGLDVEQLGALGNLHGDHVVTEYRAAEKLDLADLLLLDVSILVPCARPWTISAANATELRADMVIPGANIPVTPSAEEILSERGILYLPDFVANCGGVLAASMTHSGFRGEDIQGVIREEFARKVSRVLEEAQARNVAPADIAREVAWQNFHDIAWQLDNREPGIRALLQKTLRRGAQASLERAASIVYKRGLLRWDPVHRLALLDTKNAMLGDGPPRSSRCSR